MDVIVIESEAFQELKDMFISLVDINEKLIKENIGLKSRVLLTAREVAEMTGYNEKTIRNKRYEIGFRSEGKTIFFKTADVDAWIEKGYIRPRK